ncbi:MAG: alpha/beta hydrolase [Actinomycetota bacterium]
MTERPTLVPTSIGPAGVILGEPDGEARGAAVVLQGLASPRSGTGRILATTARALVDEGFLVLRVDYPGMGDSSRAEGGSETHRPFLREVVAWFRQETGAGPVGAVGSCYGARLALALAAEGVVDAGLLLVTPWVSARHARARLSNARRRVRRRLGLPAPLDPDAVADLRAASSTLPVRVLVGEADTQERATLRAAARRLPNPVQVDVEPGLRLHPLRTTLARQAVTAWVVRRADHLVVAETVEV